MQSVPRIRSDIGDPGTQPQVEGIINLNKMLRCVEAILEGRRATGIDEVVLIRQTIGASIGLFIWKINNTGDPRYRSPSGRVHELWCMCPLCVDRNNSIR